MSHTAELIAVGTELLLGKITNTNAQYLSKQMSALGINVFYHTVVGDNPARLKQAVEIARGRADIILTTGGLGPTYDDLTKQTLAECFGKPLVFHEDIATKIKEFFAKLGHVATENNYQQAWLPEGCTVLLNDRGTAPGCAFEVDGCLVIMLPGPPMECINMFEKQALPLLQSRADGMIVSRSLRVVGIGESAAEDLLRGLMNELQNPTLAPYAKTGEVELRITAKVQSAEEAAALIDPVEAEVRRILGSKIYGVDVDSLEQVCFQKLSEQKLTVGTAESCTGGLLAKRLTDLPGSSNVFLGGIVSYTSQLKSRLLSVPDELLLDYTPVSEAAARAMALGARELLASDIALCVTGVAGPGPDEYGNPPGLVFIALAAEAGCYVQKLNVNFFSREQVRVSASQNALDLLRRYLEGLITFS